MTLGEKLDLIANVKVNTKVKNDVEISSLLLYSIYFLYKDFQHIFDKNKDTFLSIRSTVFENLKSVNDGADEIMTFYFLNEQKIQNTDFYKTYSKYLELLKEEQKTLGIFSDINVYVTLTQKINEFEKGSDNND